MPGTPLNIIYPDENSTHVQAVALHSAAILAIQTDVEQKIVPAEIDWVTDLSARGYGLTNLGLAGFVDHGSATASAGSVIYYAGEFYMITAGGAIQLTLAGSLNAAGIGGIGGDYGGVNPASVVYDGASGEFRFTEGPGSHADLRVDDVILVGAGGGSVRLGAKADVVSAVTWSLAAPPAVGTAMLTIDSAGNVVPAALVTIPQTFTGTMTLPNCVLNTGGGVSTFANRVLFSSDVFCLAEVAAVTLRCTTALIASGTATVTGATTCNGGLTVVGGASINGGLSLVSQTHITRVHTWVMPLLSVTASAGVTLSPGNLEVGNGTVGVKYAFIGVSVPVSATVTGFSLRLTSTSATGEVNLGYTVDGGSFTLIGSVVYTVGAGIITPGATGLAHTAGSARAYYIRIMAPSSATVTVYSAQISTSAD